MTFLERVFDWVIKFRGVAAALALVTIPISLYMVFVYAPKEATMGDVQRLFYYHVGTAWNAYLFFGIVAGTSALYLLTRNERWNATARAAGELGVLFTSLTLALGSLWARPIWNVWWTWDPRLTATLILWFIYVGYLLIQGGAEHNVGRRRLGAIVGIIGFVDIPLVHYSARLWRSIHPSVLRAEGARDAGMPPEMLVTMIVSVIALTVLALAMWGYRLKIAELKERTEVLQEKMLPLGGH